jgi:hypothetical protein
MATFLTLFIIPTLYFVLEQRAARRAQERNGTLGVPAPG